MSKKEPVDPSLWLQEAITSITPDDPLRVLTNRTPYKEIEDRKGHDFYLGARFPKFMARWVELLLEKKGLPYETKTDVCRDAIYLGMLVLFARYDTDYWQAEGKAAEIVAEITQEADFYREALKVAENLKTLVKNGRAPWARGMFAQYLKALTDPHKVAYTVKIMEEKGLEDLLPDGFGTDGAKE